LLLKREIERRNAAENELTERQEGFAKDNKKLRAEVWVGRDGRGREREGRGRER
jgi:hypothetical protein